MPYVQDGVAQRARGAPDRSTPTTAWPCRKNGTSSALSAPREGAEPQPRPPAHFRTAREKQAPPRPRRPLAQRTTRDSYEPATGLSRRFRFEPAEQEPTPGWVDRARPA